MRSAIYASLRDLKWFPIESNLPNAHIYKCTFMYVNKILPHNQAIHTQTHSFNVRFDCLMFIFAQIEEICFDCGQLIFVWISIWCAIHSTHSFVCWFVCFPTSDFIKDCTRAHAFASICSISSAN